MRHLISLIDGTWMFPTKKGKFPYFTNVHKINTALGFIDRKNVGAQIVHYYRGIGSGNFVSKYLGGTVSYGLWDDIEEIYLNICSNFRSADGNEKDEIYLIGYSRGAIAARVVAGLIDVALLKSDYIDSFHLVKRAYLYRARVSSGHTLSNTDDNAYQTALVDLKGKAHDGKVKVKFLGLFDSVLGGFGITRFAQALNIESSSPAPNVDYTVHLIAADERRRLFDVSAFAGHDPNGGELEQVWVPGGHSDIGGGPGESCYALLSLLTMCDRIRQKTDLRLDRQNLIEQCFSDEALVFHQNSALRTLLQNRDLTYLFTKRRTILGTHNTKHELADYLKNLGYIQNDKPKKYENRYLDPLRTASVFLEGWPDQRKPNIYNAFSKQRGD
jgi:uncharacterized protein (DUF2235 family)